MNLLNEELGTKQQISFRLSVRKTVVYQSSVNFKKHGIYTDRKRSGKPLKTSRRDAHVIQTIALLSPLICSKKVQRNFYSQV